MSIELETTLALTEKLQQMEARAIAAERALADLKAYADDTFKLWDNDQDSKVGKRLMWMSGTGNRDYEPNLTHIHKISTTAARELMRKAERSAELETLIWDAHQRAFGARNYVYVDSRTTVDLLVADITATQHERDTLRRQLAEAEALVERMRECANRIHEIQCSKEVQAVYSLAMLHGQPYMGPTWEKEMHALRTLTPTAALAEYRREVRLEAFTEALAIAKGCKDYSGGYKDTALLEVYLHGMGTVENCIQAKIDAAPNDTQLAMVEAIGSAEIRAMKDGGK